MKDDKRKKNILIVGNSAKEHALVIKFLKDENIDKIYIAPGNQATGKLATNIDIREENIEELLKFAIDNNIDLTVASSEVAIKNDITEVFQANGQLIFAPTFRSAQFAINKPYCKKLLYKLHIPTPRFGIFEKSQLAIDYLNNCNFPTIIRSEQTINGHDRMACSTLKIAKTFIEDLFARNENKVTIEDYQYGHNFTLYVITDGYQALPINAVANYKFTQDNDGGFLTDGVGAFSPDYKISQEIIQHIMDNVIRNILNFLDKQGNTYMGILGVECVLKPDGKYTVLEFLPFLQDHDCACVLNSLEENLYKMFEACAIGSFSDEYEAINTSDYASVACVISSLKENTIINGLELTQDSQINHFDTKLNPYLEYETPKGKTLTLTASAKTLQRAKIKLYSDIEQINFNGMQYRKDICKNR